ncbi:MAG: peptidyl-prolyl cis-trans isomerase [Roseibium sp.]
MHFLLLAMALFALQAIAGGDEKEIIVVDAATQKYLFKQEEDLRLSPLNSEEKQAIIKNYIEEEILVREAAARGFTDSSRIRTLLLQNMKFFIGSELREPSDQDLREYFEANKAEFTSPPSIDLNHVMYINAKSVPVQIFDILNEADDPSQLGDLDPRLGYTIRFLDQRRLIGLFGTDTARSLLAVQKGDLDWRGPFEAPDGSAHFLRVANHTPPRTPQFEEAKDWISTHWSASNSRDRIDASLNEMRENYVVDIQPLESDADG